MIKIGKENEYTKKNKNKKRTVLVVEKLQDFEEGS